MLWFPSRSAARPYLLLGITVLLMAACIFALLSGSLPVSWSDLASLGGPSRPDSVLDGVLRTLRVPRILVATLVGGQLGLAGALLQGALRNPLASPQVIGVNAGASLAAVLVMLIWPAQNDWITPAAFAGALMAVALVSGVGALAQGDRVTALVLAGVAVSALFTAATSALMLVHADSLPVTYTWLLGGLAGRGWNEVYPLALYGLAGSLLAIVVAPRLDTLALGDEVSQSLGRSPGQTRILAVVAAALLAGSAVSVAGPIGFVGLIAPHMVRRLFGAENRWVVPASALVGALLLVAADTGARTLFQPVELPVGILTAALGAPFFLLLLTQRPGGRI